MILPVTDMIQNSIEIHQSMFNKKPDYISLTESEIQRLREEKYFGSFKSIYLFSSMLASGAFGRYDGVELRQLWQTL